MKKNNKNNSGFTLVELIIAIAILAVLMTAVSSLMGSSVLSHKKTKTEIKVHTAAQETYNLMTDKIMQAQDVIVVAYEASSEIDFSEPGAGTTVSNDLVVYVKDLKMKNYLLDPTTKDVYNVSVSDPSDIKYFSDYNGETLYLKRILIKTAEPIDFDYVPGVTAGASFYDLDDALTGRINERNRISNINASDPTKDPVYDIKDNVIHEFLLIDNNLYYGKEYSYMTEKNDYINFSSEEHLKRTLCNDGFSYVTSGTGPTSYGISGCPITFDAEKGAIGIEFRFDDLNMTYTTKGMVNTRNSYVLKAKDN